MTLTRDEQHKRPVLWRVGFIGLLVLIAGFFALGIALTIHAT